MSNIDFIHDAEENISDGIAEDSVFSGGKISMINDDIISDENQADLEQLLDDLMMYKSGNYESDEDEFDQEDLSDESPDSAANNIPTEKDNSADVILTDTDASISAEFNDLAFGGHFIGGVEINNPDVLDLFIGEIKEPVEGFGGDLVDNWFGANDAVLEQNQDAVLEQNQDAVLEQNQDEVLEQNQDAVLEQNQDAVLEQNQDEVLEQNQDDTFGEEYTDTILEQNPDAFGIEYADGGLGQYFNQNEDEDTDDKQSGGAISRVNKLEQIKQIAINCI
jgi:hypothetical protein